MIRLATKDEAVELRCPDIPWLSENSATHYSISLQSDAFNTFSSTLSKVFVLEITKLLLMIETLFTNLSDFHHTRTPIWMHSECCVLD